MHKKAMEMAKHAMEDACAKGYDCMTSQDWDDLKDCVETAEKAIKADYYYMIVCAMKEEEEYEKQEEKQLLKELKEEHGMSEEDSRRFYDAWRYKNGRFAPKGRGTRRGYEEPPYYHMMPEYRMDLADYKGKTAEEMRDMDRHTKGVMYYTEPVKMDGMRRDGMKHEESRFDRAKRGYQETKEIHKGNTPEDKRLTMAEAEKMLNVVFDEIDEMLEDAPQELKNMIKTKGMTRFQKIS